MTSDQIIKAVLGAILVAIVGGAVTLYASVQSAKTERALMMYKIEQMQNDHRAVDSLKEVTSQHWKALSFLKKEVNALRHKNGDPPANWDLGHTH